MDIHYQYPEVDYSVDSILAFLTADSWWNQPFYHFYPQVDRDKLNAMPVPQKRDYLCAMLWALCEETAPDRVMQEKTLMYGDYWKIHQNQVEDAFSDAFCCNVESMFNHVTGNISFNPVTPRYLQTASFDIFYLNSERGALGVSLHELIHFLWFDTWEKHFKDSPAEYEEPHLQWILSEMAVDPIMRKDSRLYGINPYFEDGCAYGCFYTMAVNGKPIQDTLLNMYIVTGIVEFMEQGYAYCQKHEAAIRGQMGR